MRSATTTTELIAVPATIIRGGTSKGVFLLESDLPQDRSLWGPYIMSLFGSRDPRQIDGLGGAAPTTSKCCIVGPSRQADADVDYPFAHVGIGEELVVFGDDVEPAGKVERVLRDVDAGARAAHVERPRIELEALAVAVDAANAHGCRDMEPSLLAFDLPEHIALS